MRMVLVISRAELGLARINCRDINSILLRNTNDKRALHNTSALTLNPTLISNSEQYARQLAELCSLRHAGGEFGENLFLTRGKNTDFTNMSTDFGAIDAFYSEISCYCGYETECPPCVYGEHLDRSLKATIVKYFLEKLVDEKYPRFCLIRKGHFTQLVWESTKTQGCGACLDDASGCFVVVCRYLPAGNVVGMYDANVKKPYGTQPPIWVVFQKATMKDIAIAGAILAVFFGIVVFTFMLHYNSE